MLLAVPTNAHRDNEDMCILMYSAFGITVSVNLYKNTVILCISVILIYSNCNVYNIALLSHLTIMAFTTHTQLLRHKQGGVSQTLPSTPGKATMPYASVCNNMAATRESVQC